MGGGADFGRNINKDFSMKSPWSTKLLPDSQTVLRTCNGISHLIKSLDPLSIHIVPTYKTCFC